MLYPQLPEFDALRVRLDGMRLLWRDWGDVWARDFNRLCRQHGSQRPAALQQRTLFEDVVRPLTQEPSLTVLLVVDALRYEMAEELYRKRRKSRMSPFGPCPFGSSCSPKQDDRGCRRLPGRGDGGLSPTPRTSSQPSCAETASV